MFPERDSFFSAPYLSAPHRRRVAYDRSHGKLRAIGRETDLDFLRGIAILMVLDFHAPVHWLSFPLHLLGFPEFGWAGVSIFFVLSGFLVGGLLMKEWTLKHKVDSRRFLIRRGFKIWPQYYLYLLLILLSGHRSLGSLAGNLLNVQNYTGGIPHTWSLAVEEHAYLLLALGLGLAARFRLRPKTFAAILAGTCVLVTTGRLVSSHYGLPVMSPTHTRVEGILYGVLLAMLYHFRPELFERWRSRRMVWLLALTGALVYLRFQGTAAWATSLGWDAANLLGIALLMLLYRPGRTGTRHPLYRSVAAIGVYSYGIYLWHVAVIAPVSAFAGHLPRSWAGMWLGGMPILAGIGVGVLATRVVELPALALRDRLFPRRVDSPVGVPAEVELRGALASPANSKLQLERLAVAN